MRRVFAIPMLCVLLLLSAPVLRGDEGKAPATAPALVRLGVPAAMPAPIVP